MKECINCKVTKDDSEYYPHPKKPNKTINSCKKCTIDRATRNNKSNIEARREYMKKYRADNKERLLEMGRKRDKRKRETSPLYRIRYNLSHNLRECMKRLGRNKTNSVTGLIGCSIEELIEHLNSNSYGFKFGDNGIDVDHIVPTSSVDNEDDLRRLYHFSNLQLLPSYYNRFIKKDNKFNKEHFEEWLKKR